LVTNVEVAAFLPVWRLGYLDLGGTTMDIVINVEEIAKDWVVIRPALSEFRKEVELERLPLLINKTLVAWLKERPSLKVRSTLGIVERGWTVALHIWFDQS
jgi:hypothetical protein